jgi:hypothetical protein
VHLLLRQNLVNRSVPPSRVPPALRMGTDKTIPIPRTHCSKQGNTRNLNFFIVQCQAHQVVLQQDLKREEKEQKYLKLMESAEKNIIQLTGVLHSIERELETAIDKTELQKQHAQILAELQDFSGDLFNEGKGKGYDWDLVKKTLFRVLPHVGLGPADISRVW